MSMQRGQGSSKTVTSRVSGSVEIKDKCALEDLRTCLVDYRDAVIVCDLEGYESILLDPAHVPTLAEACLLVELHEFLVPGIKILLPRRLNDTHRVELIWQQPRGTRKFPWCALETSLVPRQYLERAVSKRRSGRIYLLWMLPKNTLSKQRNYG